MAKKMAKKRPPPPPPAPSSSSSSSSEGSSSSDDQEPIDPKTPTNNKDEETDSGSDSDSGSDEEGSEEAEPGSAIKKPESVPTTAAAPTPAPKPSDVGEKSDKKGKAIVNDRFHRIWSLDDEITILKGIIEYESQHGRRFNGAVIKDFHRSVEDSLSLAVNDTQLYEKIRRLKKKYRTAAARAKRTGKAVNSGKPHDEKVYELSKEIWGAGSENETEVRVNSRRASKRRAAAAGASDGGRGSLKRNYLFMKEALVKAGRDISAEEMAAIDPERAMYLENEFKKQRVIDLKSTIHEIDLVKQALTLIVEEIEGRR